MHKRLQFSIAAVVVIALLAGCQPAVAPTTTNPAATTTPPSTATSRPSPTTSAPVATTTPAGQPQYGGILKVASQASPSTLIPETQLIRQWFLQGNYDALLRIDENGQLQPNLATEFEFSSDMKSLRLALRKGVKFHDGTDFNAEAAKWAILLKQKAGFGEYSNVTSIDVIDDYNLRLNLSHYDNTLLSALWFIGGMMHSPTNYAKWGKDDVRWNPVGTGPFKFVKYDLNQVVKYERFDAYWMKGKPYLDGYEQYPIADETTRQLALRRGEMHAAEALSAKTINDLRNDGWTAMVGPVEVYNLFATDSKNQDSPFFDKRVRIAMEHALDREGVVKALGYGQMEPMYQNAPSNSYGYIPNFEGRKYDPEKAKQLLAEAGYPNGFKTYILVPFSTSEPLNAAQGYLRAVGIDAEIKPIPIVNYYNTVRNTGWNTGIIFRARRQVPDYIWDQYKEWSNTSIDLKSTFRPPGLQPKLEAVMAATDDATRKTAAQDFVRMVYDEALAVPMWGSNYTIVRAANVVNLDYYVPWGPNKFWTPADTWLKK